MKPGFINTMTEDRSSILEITKRLNQIFMNLFYQVQVLAIKDMNNDSIFAGSPLSVTPLVLPNIVGSGHSKIGTVKLDLSERLLIDASEFLNAVYDDMS